MSLDYNPREHDLIFDTYRGLAQGFYPKIKWEALVLCEPMIMPLESGNDFIEVLGDGAMKRRDIWPSREEAYRTFTDRGRIWRTWDPRVRRLFVVRVSLGTS